MAEGQSDSTTASYLDFFCATIGVVLLLMVLAVLGIKSGSPAKGRLDAGPMPLMLTVTWSRSLTQLPDVDIEYALIRYDPTSGRLDGADTRSYVPIHLDEAPEFLETLSVRGTTADGPDASQDTRADRDTDGKTLVFQAGRGQHYKVLARIQFSKPREAARGGSGHPYNRLTDKIKQEWSNFFYAQARGSGNPQKLRDLCNSYKEFVEYADSFRTDWNAREQDLYHSKQGIPSAEWAATLINARIGSAKELLRRAVTEGWTYPTNEDGSDFFAQFHRPDNTYGDEWNAVSFEKELTRMMLDDTVAPRSPQDPRRRWVLDQLSLLTPGAELPVRLTLIAPGFDKQMMDEPANLRNMFVKVDDRGFRPIAEVNVDAAGKANVIWDPDIVLTPSPSQVNTSAPARDSLNASDHNQSLSRWEIAFNKSMSSPDDVELRKHHIDGAIKYLADNQKAGNFHCTQESQYDGAAVTGLSLMAFVVNGHLVNQSGSPYQAVTRKAAGELAKELLSYKQKLIPPVGRGSIFKQADWYHLGFGTLAMAYALPGVHCNCTDDPALKETCDSALKSAVHIIIESQGPTGGWGYGQSQDDSSIAAIMVDALARAKPLLTNLTDSNDKDLRGIETSLDSAHGFLLNCRGKDKTRFLYTLSGSDLRDDSRLPGCSLALALSQRSNRWPSFSKSDADLQRILQWSPKWEDFNVPSGNGRIHYRLFYAAQVMVCSDVDDEWFNRMQGVLVQSDGGSFQGDTYGNAMAIIAMSLRFQHLLETSAP